MYTSRGIDPSDRQILAESLVNDPYHHGSTTPDFFYTFGSVCNVYEDEHGPVLFCRGAKALRLDIQFIDNRDFRRNRAVLIEGFPGLIEKARNAGFTEVIFNSNSPLLRKFCVKHFGFQASGEELRKII